MAAPVEQPENLAGSDVYGQAGEKLGEIRQLYGPDGEERPSWFGVVVSTGLAGGRLVLVPLARLKQEDGQVRVPYSRQHLLEAPEVPAGEALSEEDDAALRDFYALSRGDQPAEDSPDSYAAQMPENDPPPRPLDSAG